METAKQLAMKVLQAMPDDCTWEQVRYRIELCAKIEISEAEIDAGRGIPNEQVMQEMEQWLKSFPLLAHLRSGLARCPFSTA